MPFGQSKSTLAKKYGSHRVAMARNLMMARLGLPLNSDTYNDKLPWALIGQIAKNSATSGKDVSMADIKDAKNSFKKHGIERSLREAHIRIQLAKGKKNG